MVMVAGGQVMFPSAYAATILGFLCVRGSFSKLLSVSERACLGCHTRPCCVLLAIKSEKGLCKLPVYAKQLPACVCDRWRWICRRWLLIPNYMQYQDPLQAHLLLTRCRSPTHPKALNGGSFCNRECQCPLAAASRAADCC